MESPSELFVVPALNSFHMGAKKGKAEARQRFDIANVEKPKLPSILGFLQSSKDQKAKAKTTEAKTISLPRALRPAVPKKSTGEGKIVNTISLDIVPICDAHLKRAREALLARAVQQTSTPPPEKSATPRAPTKAANVLATSRKVTPPSTMKTVVPAKSSVQKPATTKVAPIVPSRTKVVQQLLTPPATPPLVVNKKVVPAKSADSQPKGSTKIPRSTPMVFPKVSKPKVVAKAVTPKAPSPVKVVRPTARVSIVTVKPSTPAPRVGRLSPVSPLAPKPASKLVRSTATTKIASRVPRTATPKPSPVKLTAVKPIKVIIPAKRVVKAEVPVRSVIKAEVSLRLVCRDYWEVYLSST